MPEPRKHHYISQFYLRWFSFNSEGINPQCFFYHIPNDSSVLPSNIENIASQRDLFALTLANGEKDYSLEKDFSIQETSFASNLESIIEKIKSNGKFVPEEENILIDLMLFQLKKSIVVSTQYKQKTETMKQEINKEVDEKFPKHRLLKEDFDRWMKNSAILTLKEWWLEKEFEKYDMKGLLLDRNRYFFQITDHNKSFVTSDMPLYRYNNPWESDWVANPNTQIIFPLSAKILMVIHKDWKRREKITINDNEFVKKANGMIISNASNFIIWNNQKLIQKMKEWKNGWTKKYLYSENVLFLSDKE